MGDVHIDKLRFPTNVKRLRALGKAEDERFSKRLADLPKCKSMHYAGFPEEEGISPAGGQHDPRWTRPGSIGMDSIWGHTLRDPM